MDHEKMERSLIIIKPDAIQRGLVGKVIERFENKGLIIMASKMLHLEDAILEEHYSHIKDQPFFGRIKKLMKAAPVIVMVFGGINAVNAIRTIVGPTKGYEAPGGTIRGDFSMSIQSNIVHASDSLENAEQEIARFFSESEILNYEKLDAAYVYSENLMT